MRNIRVALYFMAAEQSLIVKDSSHLRGDFIFADRVCGNSRKLAAAEGAPTTANLGSASASRREEAFCEPGNDEDGHHGAAMF